LPDILKFKVGSHSFWYPAKKNLFCQISNKMVITAWITKFNNFITNNFIYKRMKIKCPQKLMLYINWPSVSNSSLSWHFSSSNFSCMWNLFLSYFFQVFGSNSIIFGNVEFLDFIFFEMSKFKEIKKEGYYYYYYYNNKTIGLIMLEVQSPGTYQKSCL
jgi:hypothetical protein